MDDPPHLRKYYSLYNHFNHSSSSLPNMPEEDQTTRDVREAIMNECSIEPPDEVPECGRLIAKANNCEGPFHGQVKGVLDDEDDNCDEKNVNLFMIALFLLFSIACAGNFFVGVYATLHNWSRTDVGLHLAVGNPMFVCAIIWLCKNF